MDNLTHSLTGLALARAGLNRFSPHATLLLILSANAPDLDIVMATKGALPYLEAHRGYSHSLVCLPFLAALPVLVAAAIFRQRLSWRKAWLLCSIGIASHLLMDWTNSYGVRLLLPFSSQWFFADLNSLYDGYIMVVLLLAAVWPLFARLVSTEIGDRSPAGKGIAIFALAFFVLFDCGKAALHARAVAQLESRLYDDAPPLQTAALPEPFSPFRWSGIVETATDYRVIPLDALRQLDVEDAATFYKPAITPALERARSTAPFRFFQYFARFPTWTVQPVLLEDGAQGRRVELTDLRFGVPGRGAFHCIAVANNQDHIVESVFTYGSGANLGRSKGQGL